MYNMMSYRKQTKAINNRTYTDFYYRLMMLARTVFEWEGLPNGIDEKWIESYLYHEGECMFFYDERFGFMVAKTAHNGRLNEYDEPTTLRPIFTNYTAGKTKTYKNNTECVLIRNNDIPTPTIQTIDLFALRLMEIQRAIDVNINAMKTPVLIKCNSDKQKQSLKTAYEQWNGFEPVIYVDKLLDTAGIDTLNTSAPIVFDKLQMQKHAIWNECMTFLGINNANMDKRERLVDDEVQANNEQIGLSASVMLKARQRAADQINKLFGDAHGFHVSVKIRDSVKDTAVDGYELKEGAPNG